jgi:hypothetical protein
VSPLAVPAVVVTAWLHPPFEEDLRTGHTPRIEMLFAGIIAAGAGACVLLSSDRPLEGYYVSNAFSQRTVFVEGLLGVLFSPSRGLFVFSPVLLLATSGFMFAIRDTGNRPRCLTYGAIVLGITLIAGAANMWWGGHSYGPRLMTDVLPLLVFFVAFNLRPPPAVPLRGRVLLVAAVAVLAIVGTAIHARGVFRQETWLWNAVPENVDENPARLWDWSDPQFAR